MGHGARRRSRGGRSRRCDHHRREGLEGRHAEPRRVLDAEAGADEAHRRVPQDAAGSRYHHPGVLRPVLRPGAGGRERATGRRCRPQHRERHQRPRRQGADRQEVGQAELQRRRLELGRRLRPPRRQPEEDQGLERPDQARRTGRDGEPVHRGDREVEHSRVLRRAAPARQDRRAGARLAAEVLRAMSSRRTRPARMRRTRSSRARATSCSRSRARRSTGSSRT